MKTFKFIGLAVVAVMMVSCNSNQSLQEYYVDNQGDKEFVAVDVPTSLFANTEALNEDQKRTLETVKKVNVIAIPKKPENQEKINIEKDNISKILKDEKYQLLMKFGGSSTKLEVYFTGNEEAVDEIIVYGYNDEKGMGIARVLGDNMNPSDILNLVSSMQKGDINMSGLKEITGIFADKS
ncbi:protein of unknown function [Gillisia sp. Hel1_33_143]|uniref:DUF4252 domain-containing protein n=1 Tax=Gillisia sp. Hel1_33_143 TaxID=1336796 RepID=UPI00087A2044|nr:DUF4252 domain-containing protein [Gillisia sp. Hel1_33_143]SDS49537.1 protein of unknown function [Gillisia sp. Hel1_33_143]